MAIIYENISDTLIKAYSDKGFYIHGGSPAGDYAEAIDPIEMYRTYVETDIPIDPDPEPQPEPVDPDEATIEDYQDALRNMGVKLDEED